MTIKIRTLPGRIGWLSKGTSGAQFLGALASRRRIPVFGFQLAAKRRCSRGENFPNERSRMEPSNRSSRRKEAPSEIRMFKFEPPYVGCYEVQGESIIITA